MWVKKRENLLPVLTLLRFFKEGKIDSGIFPPRLLKEIIRRWVGKFKDSLIIMPRICDPTRQGFPRVARKNKTQAHFELGLGTKIPHSLREV